MFKWLEARRARKQQAERTRAQAARSNPHIRSDSPSSGVEDAVIYNNWGVPGQAGHVTAPTPSDDNRHGDQGSRDHSSFKTGGGFGGEHSSSTTGGGFGGEHSGFHTGGSMGSHHDSGSSHSSSDSSSSSSSDSGSSGGDGGGGGGGD